MKRIIQEWEIDEASRSGKTITIDQHTMLTPAAKDRAKELGISLHEAVTVSEVDEIKEIFPVKKIALAADHGGFEVKEILREFLRKQGYTVHDLGPSTDAACDYPDYALKTAQMVSSGQADRGIMIDSVGIGSAMAANRVKGVLAAKCNNAFEARSAREHNYANMLTLGSKIIGIEIIKDIVSAFLTTRGGAERHQKRIKKILQLDRSK